jgi:hypothetical protein
MEKSVAIQSDVIEFQTKERNLTTQLEMIDTYGVQYFIGMMNYILFKK